MERAIKRLFDVVLSVLALVVLSPVFLITALAIKAEDGGLFFTVRSAAHSMESGSGS